MKTRQDRIDWLDAVAQKLFEQFQDTGDYRDAHEIGVLVTRCDEMSARLEEKTDVEEMRTYLTKLEERVKLFESGPVLINPGSAQDPGEISKPS